MTLFKKGYYQLLDTSFYDLKLHFMCMKVGSPQSQELEPRRDCAEDVITVLQSERLHRKYHKVDSTGLINKLRMQPAKKSRLLVPLCRLVVMDEVRAVGELDVQKLETEFVNGYREGDRVLFVSPFNNKEWTMDVTNRELEKWGSHWNHVNNDFEKELEGDDDLTDLRGRMFFVWDGNHRVTAWMRHIRNCHSNDPDWHIRVQCIFLDPRGQVGNLLNAMSDVNWYVHVYPLLVLSKL
jgi:hypothetical protein